MFDMKFLQSFLLFLAFSKNVTSGIGISYSELRELNATCYPDDTCSPEDKDLRRDEWSRVCGCERDCMQYGTCCIDSRYVSIKQPKLRYSCRSTDFHSPYFMVDNCWHGDTTGTIWEQLCNADWNGEDDDIMKLVPVTSIFTSITYKSYFCFRCHERTDDFVYWKVFMDTSYGSGGDLQTKDDGLTYSNADNTWVVPLVNGNTLVPVNLTFSVPREILWLVYPCNSDLIRGCSEDWCDDTIREKCHAYSAVVYIERDGFYLAYKNPHCALCNFEFLNETMCSEEYRNCCVLYGYDGKGSGRGKFRFSFKSLLHNPTDCGVNQIWDPKFEKCKTLSCVLPGYVVKGDKCVPP